MSTGLKELTTLTSLEACNHHISDVEDDLSPSLKSVAVAGCQLIAVPTCLTKLTALQRLNLAANSIVTVDAAWSCKQLLQLNLSFNAVSTLVNSNAPDSRGLLLAGSPVMVLDLAHNNICDLSAALCHLQQLSRLQSLSLAGNPVSLLPSYQAVILQQLPRLQYLDGQVCKYRHQIGATAILLYNGRQCSLCN
jgi:Leucine-rich repeat (LRR) protein